MEKKYQIFVSSTYLDLMDERAAITQAIVEMQHIPVAMEFFPASNLSQLDYIKKLIDNIDYYVLIVGGRYGSIEEKSGKSFTQLEYEYAAEKGIPILFFYHSNPSSIPVIKTDDDPEKRTKLYEFIKLAKEGKLSKEYATPDDLSKKFILSLIQLISDTPRVGWIRGDMGNNNFLIEQVEELSEKKASLEKELTELRTSVVKKEEDVIGFDEPIRLFAKIVYHSMQEGVVTKEYSLKIVLSEFIKYYGYLLINGFTQNDFYRYMNEYVEDIVDKEFLATISDLVRDPYSGIEPMVSIDDSKLYALINQLVYYSVIYVDVNGNCFFTELGEKLLRNGLLFRKE